MSQTSDVEVGLNSSDNGAEKTRGDPLIDWEGPDDPENPRNWPSLKKSLHVVLISIFTLYGNLASTMFAPGASQLVREFGITSEVLAAFTVSIYLLGFALGPLVISPLSEVYGRLVTNQVCNLIFIAFTIGCAASTSSPMFFVFRFIAGCACSAPMTIGGAVIADVTHPEKRGKAMAVWAMGPLLGPAGVVFVVALFTMRETNATILLQRKAARLRSSNEDADVVTKGDSRLAARKVLLRAILRPTRLLLFSPIVTLLSLYGAVVFSLIYLLFTTFPDVFETQYGFSVELSGLAYLGLGIGFIVGIGIFGATNDLIYKKLKGDGEGTPEMRLPGMMWLPPMISAGFFWYGWTAQYQVHWIVPIIGTSLIAIGSLFVTMPSQIYIVDAFGPATAASALAASSVLRTLAGAFFTLAGPPLYSALGLGWGNTLLGFVCLLFLPVPFLFYRYGGWLRKRFVFEP
ncbi:putative Major facilitator superfamily domain-containing protein [Seiridium unicorne]|uniref:Major facilitator superfamily domain-containing protein n=1 Tax=Seiridium unicorne TaxID=138068 RepID=A0ABR2UFA7_9PEZI